MFDRTFQYFDAKENSNKSWRIKWDNGTVTTFWGRVGHKQSQKTKPMTLGEAESLIRSKTRDGYEEIERAVVNTVETPVAASTRAKRCLELIAKAARESIQGYLAVPTDNLSLTQIERGRNLLKKISKGDTQLLSEYYRAIPTVLPHKIIWEDLVRDFDAGEQENRLNQLEAEVETRVEVKSDSPFSLSDASDEDAEAVEKLVVGTARHNDRKFSVKEIFEVHIFSERSEFEKNDVGNVKRLFHGTAPGNVFHILRSGLLVPSYCSNGRAFGDGIYFADVSTKSIGYCGYEGDKFLLVADVKLGKPYTPAASYEVSRNKEAPKGYHSIAAIAGKTSILAYSEYVVYNRSQQTIRFLVRL